ncbi:NAD-dependent succinate-semialdehyde dehydrogenase [uncultured Sunxiuqinia sp.]|uniref:NAD-dependent succinate-semialdehyde dehydrogenase n=1 Tax=uncultured Sunxiuqinia sp. TaxID=1573825 RepID=UPI0030D96EC6|tara:strand:+ start:1993 stop:3354 length:1362 start_codon:yes stop_codon:yes gene_type:complete
MKSINPFTNKVVETYSEHSDADAKRIIKEVDLAYKSWKQSTFEERASHLLQLEKQLLEQQEFLADLIVTEMGKVKKESLGEIKKCAWVCRYYAENGARFLERESIASDASESFVSFQPLGTVLAVMPWNFPFWQVFRFLAPALMAGNTAVLKHASNVPGCSLAIEKLVQDAGFPKDVFRSLLIGGKSVKQVIENPKVKAVTLTGSTPAGKSVAAAAGSVLKKSVLELGGSDPYLILEDADIEEAAHLCATSRLLNAGQSCIGAKRFIVVEQVYEQFRDAFVKKMKDAQYGDPYDEKSAIGPLARIDLRNELHGQVSASVAKGAKILCGGYIPEHEAAFYPPTVLENIEPGMPAYDEELFGPVASLFKVKTEEEGIRIANDTVFGLGAGVFTGDLDRGKQLAEKGLDAGCVFVNDFVKSDPRLPFGGIKESGFGRELSVFGIREFVNIKTVAVK